MTLAATGPRCCTRQHRNSYPYSTGPTAGRCSRVTGSEATRLLEKVCGIDWSDHMTPDGAVLSASVALVTCDIARNDVSEDDTSSRPSYLIFCDRSFGQYLFDALIERRKRVRPSGGGGGRKSRRLTEVETSPGCTSFERDIGMG